MPTGPRPAPPAGTCRCSVSGLVQTHKWACIFWLNLTSANPQLADLTALASKISQAWATHISAIQAADTSMNNVLLVWTPTAGNEIVSSDSTSHPGTFPGTSAQYAGASYVINHRTGSYYRGGHPRSYVPGVPVGHIANGSTLTGTYPDDAAGAWAGFVDAIQTGPAGGITTSTCGTVRFQSKDAWLVPPTFVPWQSHSCRPTLGTIKARLTE